MFLGGVCMYKNEIFFLNFTVVFVSPQEVQIFKPFWIPACIFNVIDRQLRCFPAYVKRVFVRKLRYISFARFQTLCLTQ